MGCFSFLCKESGKAVASSSFDDGESDAVRMYLLENGKVIEEMKGHYDSYGRVFDKEGNRFEWKTDWTRVAMLINHNDRSNGLAVILECYFNDETQIPTTRSEIDANQGWGECNGQYVVIDEPYHKVY